MSGWSMSEYAGTAEEHGRHAVSPISVPWVVGAALLAAAGLLVLWQAVTTIEWVYFVIGTLLVFVSTLMFLNDRAGLDHA
jgi:hypothetical protein